MAVLGDTLDPKTRTSSNVTQAHGQAGIFSGPHGSFWVADGNLSGHGWSVSAWTITLVRKGKTR
ncbi:MAG: hypothetical protein ACKO1M_09470 [Planctomycetota bacterium]